MTNKITKVSVDVLKPVIESRVKAVEAAKVAEQAMKEARVAELEFKVQIQQFYIENNLNVNCRVNTDTGEITWPEEASEQPKKPEPELEKPKLKKQSFLNDVSETKAKIAAKKTSKNKSIVDAEFVEAEKK